MSEHLSLEACKRLKALGYPQPVDQPTEDMEFDVTAVTLVWASWWASSEEAPCEAWGVMPISDYLDMKRRHKETGREEPGIVLCPPLITADGTGGVFGWFEAQGAEIIVNSAYSPYYIMTLDKGARIVATGDTPEALVLAALDALEALS